ncbi:SLAP domain-containing protein [Sporosarcina sp.]|uniref:SLAP domain-containing protein n=1 Tax=Sporosarcina sp. TaxID=49982 RepID=UPI00260A400B|nr:SLAP domain-containing protein [Sporosarcina sp.]
MQVIFEKTWEDTLSDKQKQAFIQKYGMKDMVNGGFTASPILMKKKRNGGLVATVFLQNNSSVLLSLNEIFAHIENDSGETVAEEHFTLSLEIPPFAATPWSLVFSPDHVNTVYEPLDSWKLVVK